MTCPVMEVLPELRLALVKSTRVLLSAPPGAGKSTVLPLELLDEEWLAGRKILLLEPRRLAAYGVARRMADTLGEEPGGRIGYRMRMDSKVGPETRIEVVTEGVFTRMLQSDPELADYGCVIFDEFHERGIHAELGLALTLDAQSALREDLRILVMSATLDCERLADLLGDCPVIASGGRSYEVETIYVQRPPATRIETLACDTVSRALELHSGGVLVFMPGEGAIRTLADALRKRVDTAKIMICPLYGRLTAEEQRAALSPAPSGKRKVVVATSIAESSLTIDGIGVVVDGGLTRRQLYDPGTGMERLETVKISRASSDQRRGRAGRQGPGVCYRLWSESMQSGLDAHTPPEICHADLAPLVLELALWGVADPAELKWLDLPDPARFCQARELLRGLEALDDSGRIIGHGRELARTGLHPRLAHMLVRSINMGMGSLGCEIAALMTEFDSRRFESLDMLDAVMSLRSGSRGFEAAAGFAAMLRRRMGIKDGKIPVAECGSLLALGWPDRVGKRREQGGTRYLLSCGRGAYFRERGLEGNPEYIVAPVLDGGEREAEIRQAAAFDPGMLAELFPGQLNRSAAIEFDPERDLIRFEQRHCFGRIVLSARPLSNPGQSELSEALRDLVTERGIGVLRWTPEAENLRDRMRFVRRNDPGGDWPDVDDKPLLQCVDKWLLPFTPERPGRDFLSGMDICAALLSLLSYERQRELERLAPERLKVPTGTSVRIDYSGERPVLAVRLQELFGCAETPALMGGRVRVLLHLLSPARRPLQITDDLAGFWTGSYKLVKAEMKGRYPRHYWPDNPLEAEPTTRAKKRHD